MGLSQENSPGHPDPFLQPAGTTLPPQLIHRNHKSQNSHRFSTLAERVMLSLGIQRVEGQRVCSVMAKAAPRPAAAVGGRDVHLH